MPLQDRSLVQREWDFVLIEDLLQNRTSATSIASLAGVKKTRLCHATSARSEAVQVPAMVS
jgi:hypothetical protein